MHNIICLSNIHLRVLYVLEALNRLRYFVSQINGLYWIVEQHTDTIALLYSLNIRRLCGVYFSVAFLPLNVLLLCCIVYHNKV